MRILIFGVVVGLTASSYAQTVAQFSQKERADILRYWSAPDRYTVGLPDDVTTTGAWQVRQTVSGSVWLWNYQRGKKNPAIDVVPPTTPQQVEWETWVNARIVRDRWEAWQTASTNNLRDLGLVLPLADKTIPDIEPPDPGPAPDTLTAFVGEPPKFAEAAVPMQHRVRLDDQTLVFRDRFRPGSPRYAYFRFEQGVGDAGTLVKAMPPSQLSKLFSMAGVTETEAKIMRAVSLLEGGFDAVNTYDTGFVSIGFIQFACLKEGGGSLGAMLRQYKRDCPVEFQRDFRGYGLDVTEDGKLAVLDLTTGEERVGPDAAAEIIEDKRYVAVFQRAGRSSEPFIAAQIRAAKSMYLPQNDPISVTVDGRTVSGRVADFVKSEAGIAILMDRKVNTGNINPLPALVSELATTLKPRTLADLAPYERQLVQGCKYRRDYLADDSLAQPSPSPVLGGGASKPTVTAAVKPAVSRQGRTSKPATSRGTGGRRTRRGG